MTRALPLRLIALRPDRLRTGTGLANLGKQAWHMQPGSALLSILESSAADPALCRCCPNCGSTPPEDAPWLLCSCAPRESSSGRSSATSENMTWLRRAVASGRADSNASELDGRAASVACAAMATDDREQAEFGAAAMALLVRRSAMAVHAAGGGAATVSVMRRFRDVRRLQCYGCSILAELTSEVHLGRADYQIDRETLTLPPPYTLAYR